MNKWIGIGNVAHTPELRQTPNGLAVCTFSLAVSRRGGKETDFVRVTAWRKLAENCAAFLEKGRKVCVTGEIYARGYEAKDGTSKAALEVDAVEVEFLSPRGESQERRTEPASERVDDVPTLDDDDLPF